jgi:hypothetical protein
VDARLPVLGDGEVDAVEGALEGVFTPTAGRDVEALTARAGDE